jgi:hypothetical protein
LLPAFQTSVLARLNVSPMAPGGRDACRLCNHDGKFRDGRMHCAHCGAGKGKSLGLVPLGKGGRSDAKSKGDGKSKVQKVVQKISDSVGKKPAAKSSEPPRAKAGAAAADAATVAAVYKELVALRAENAELRKNAEPRKKKGGSAKDELPVTPSSSGEPGVGDDAAIKAKKLRMDELRLQIEHLSKGGEGLDEILKTRRDELERLRVEVRAASPLDVQLRNLDSKLAGVRKQKQKLEDEAKSTAALILELKAALDKTAKAATDKQAEEEQLARERVELVAKQNATKLAEAEAAAGRSTGGGSLPEQFRGLLEDLDPGLKAGLQEYFARKASAAAPPPIPPPTATRVPQTPPGEPAAAVAAAAAAAAQIVDDSMGDNGEGGDDAAKRRRVQEAR